MKRSVEEKRVREERVVKEMITLYCRHHHGSALCPDCEELLAYAHQRSEKCPFMETKTFCSNCRVHCYDPAHRARIRSVMRYSGPRMLFHHPLLAIAHVIETKKEQRRMRREENK